MKRYLILDDGTVIEGIAFGANTADVTGEIAVSTAVFGFNKSIASLDYENKIVMQTFPAIGNRGMSAEEAARKCCLSAYIVNGLCDTPSGDEDHRHTVDELLKANGIPGIKGVDCRALMRRIRLNGIKSATVTDALPFDGTEV